MSDLWVGISGPIASGKTTLAYRLVSMLARSNVVSFSTALKYFCSFREKIHQAFLLESWGYRNEDIERVLFLVDAATRKYTNISELKNRRLLQVIGTDIMRNKLDQDIWVKRVQSFVAAGDYSFTFTDDVRFDNEASAVDVHIQISTSKYPVLYLLNKVSIAGASANGGEYFYSNHASENSLTAKPDFIVDVGFTEEEIMKLAGKLITMRAERMNLYGYSFNTKNRTTQEL